MIRTALSYIFSRIIAARNAGYDTGRRKTVRCPLPVVSIGNLTVGGAGKTPVTAAVVELLRELGHRPAIVALGYGRNTSGLVVVHDGTTVIASTSAGGDEPVMLAIECNVPVAVHDSKTEAALYAAEYLPCSVIVVDDGFQHRGLARDVDIVVVDRATINDTYLMPRGRLREPLSSLARAACVVCSDDVRIHEVSPYMNPSALAVYADVVAHEVDLQGHAALAVTSIARPERFIATLHQLGIAVADHIVFPDHATYSVSRVDRVIARAAALGVSHVVTTSKDAVKINEISSAFADANITIHVIEIQARIEHNRSALLELLHTHCPL